MLHTRFVSAFARATLTLAFALVCSLACGCAAGVELPDKRPDDFRVEMTGMLYYTGAGTDRIRVTGTAAEWHRSEWAIEKDRQLTLRFTPEPGLLDALYASSREARLHTMWSDQQRITTQHERLAVSVDGNGLHFAFSITGSMQVNDEARLKRLASAIHNLGALPLRRPMRIRLTVDQSCWPMPENAMLGVERLRSVKWLDGEAGEPMKLELFVETDDWTAGLDLLLPSADGKTLRSATAIPLKTDALTSPCGTLKRDGDTWTFTQP